MSAKFHIFTSAALNYLPKVRTLFRSLKQHHPEAILHLALPDQHATYDFIRNEPIDEILPLPTLGIPNWEGWAFCHDLVELSTAIKPFAFRRLMERPDGSKVIYLDPDTVVFSRIDDIIDALDDSNVLLTPHQTTPEHTLETIIDNEICSLKHGIYNLGFLGVAATDEGKRFAEWWSRRTYYFCRADIPNGLFTDQRWIDLAPAFFEGVAIMRSPRHNVATWNLTTRDFEGNVKKGFTVDGEPLGFYHFTGFDSGAHRVMAAKNAQSHRATFNIINWYESETRPRSDDPLSEAPWAFGRFSTGEPILPVHRAVYRARPNLQRAFPNPFEVHGFLDWWQREGPGEFPKLFDPDLADDELRRLQTSLDAGFRGGEDSDAGPRHRAFLSAAIHDPETRRRLGKRAWEVLRTEGIRGVVRKLVR